MPPRRSPFSFPSMRVGTLTPELMRLVREVRKTGFTLAPEAGSERLRRVINKGIRDEDLLDAAGSAFRLGWRLLKLYFMIGLPTEEPADLDAMADLCFKVWNLAKPSRSSINISISTFVPKPMTPFQWVGQLPRQDVENRLNELRERLGRRGMRFKWHEPAHSVLEAVFARGDRRLGEVLLRAWELGARFDGWTEHFREDVWDQAFREVGLDPAFYALRSRPCEEVLPWDHLSARVERGFLRAEYERALAGEYTPDCRWDRCSTCGVCDGDEIRPRLHESVEGAFYPRKEPVPEPCTEGFQYWMQYTRLGKVRFFGQLEIAQCFARAVRRSGLRAAYTRGFHPHLKLSFNDALPVGMESRVAEACLTLAEPADPEKIRAVLNCHLPEGMRVDERCQVGEASCGASESAGHLPGDGARSARIAQSGAELASGSHGDSREKDQAR